ncbi:MAG: alkyl/aryl-sulfatase [Myxococcota bacterium]
MRWICALGLLGLTLSNPACGPEEAPPGEPAAPDVWGHSAPTATTRESNLRTGLELPLADEQDFADATRGLVAHDPEVVVEGPEGEPIWDSRQYGFVHGPAPASVNPSLWRQARLNAIHGLFEVSAGIHQVRGYDISNLTLIDGESGWIVVDPLTSVETARAALALARRKLGDHRISAVILTHSHIDHFGGILAVLPEDSDARAGVRIVAPAGFIDEATSENVLAGVTMARRAAFMFGMPLARGPRGHVDSGLGREPARGSLGLARPTDIVDRTPQPMQIDGVRFIFQYAPESEAPAELTFYLPAKRAFCGAEIVSHTMHNLYTLRGARVRDALRWSGYIDEAIRLFPDAELVFASHHWPVWGKARVRDHLEKQRDTYRYIHDQTLRLASSGATPTEIAETLELPSSLRTSLANRGYYGTVRHNARAVYQRYFGWYDGNPAHLDPLPPAETGKRYVALMGGAQAVLEAAEEAFERGEYRWVATLLDHLVFAEPSNRRARELLARTYDQLGYRAESGPWRDSYLTGAFELRHGPTRSGIGMERAMELLRHVPMERFLASLATRLNGPEAEGKRMTIRLVFTDLAETYTLSLRNAVLHHQPGAGSSQADAEIRLSKRLFLRMVTRQLGLRELIFSDELDVEGSRMALLRFFSLLEPPQEDFAIVTP